MHNFIIKSDSQILKDVKQELEFDPSVTAKGINISVRSGVVTLNGCVPHYSEKSNTELAVQRVSGVRAITDELSVFIEGTISDESIAKAALTVLDWNYLVSDSVIPIVENGWITLSGKAVWEFERVAAFDAVKGLLGVNGVINNIVLDPESSSTDLDGSLEATIEASIEAALVRSAKDEADSIHVAVVGGNVSLWGKVRSRSRMNEARTAAWNANGVSKVIDGMSLSPE